MININNLEKWIKDKHKLNDFRLSKIYFISKNIILYWNWFIHYDTIWNIIWRINKFNLSNPIEKTLAKIYSFYVILNWLENIDEEILYSITYLNTETWIDLFWCQDMWDYWIILWEEKVEFYCSEHQLWENTPPISNWYINYQELYLLMQIYFWLYNEEELKKELEIKDIKWEYEEAKELLDINKFYEINKKRLDEINKKRKKEDKYGILYIEDLFTKEILIRKDVQEYCKLKLMQKNIFWAFIELKLEKIYDKNWSEEKQKKSIEEINKEYGEKVIVFENN